MKIAVNGKQIWVNYHHLYYFYVVVNEGSLSNASRVLLIGQPSLSSQIRQFEQTLGLDLFDRTHKKHVLTAAGKITHQFAEKIFKLGQEMVEALQPRLENQEIKIGIFDNISKHSMIDICKIFINGSSSSLNISRGKSTDLIKELNHRNLDYLITNYPPSPLEAPGIVMSKIESSPIIICGTPLFQHLIQDFPRSLDQAPFILPLPGSAQRIQLENFFSMNGIKTKLVGESKDFSIQKLITLEGLALMAAPLSSVQTSLERKELVEIGRPEHLSEELYLLSNLSAPIEAFEFELLETVS